MTRIKANRFAYQVQIPQVYVAIIQVFLVAGLAVMLLIVPFIFSPYSPRLYNTRKATVTKVVDDVQKKEDSGYILMWKELEVKFSVSGVDYQGVVEYCSYKGYSRDEVLDTVRNCAMGYSYEVGNVVNGYQTKSQTLTEKDNFMQLKESIQKEYNYEMLFDFSLGLIYLVCSLLFEISSIVFVEMRWKKFFTLIKTSQLPKPIGHKSSQDFEPLILQKANYDSFGRMTMKRGCLVCPKFQDEENVQKRYRITSDTPSHNGYKENSGWWKVFAASSPYKKEKIIWSFSYDPKKLILSFKGLRKILSLPIAMIVIVFVLLIVLYVFIQFEGASMAMSAICVIVSIIVLYVIGAIFEFFAGILQIFTEKVIITDSRIIFAWMERFNQKIEYVYYKDIEGISYDENNNRIDTNLSQSIIDRVFPLVSRNETENVVFVNPMGSYLKNVDKEEMKRLTKLIQELKEKDKNRDPEKDENDEDNEELLEQQDNNNEENNENNEPEIKITIDDNDEALNLEEDFELIEKQQLNNKND